MPALPIGLTSLGYLPQDQRGSCAVRHGNSREGSMESTTSGLCPSPSSMLMKLELLPCAWSCDRDTAATEIALSCPPRAQSPDRDNPEWQGWDRGAQKSSALQIPRAEPRPSRKEGPPGECSTFWSLWSHWRELGQEARIPSLRKEGGYRTQNETG